MDSREFLKVDEIELLLNDPEFAESLEIDSEIDIIQLPPDKVDTVSDLEDIDEDDLGDACLTKDVPGRIEIHFTEKETVQDQSDRPTLEENKFESSGSNKHRPTDCGDNLPKKKKQKISPSDNICAPSTSKSNINNNRSVTDSSRIKKTRTPRTSIPVMKDNAKNRKKSTKNDSDWQKEHPNFVLQLPPDDFIVEHRERIKEQLKDKTPVEVFETLFDEEIMQHIVQESVVYAVQQNRHDFTFTTDCLRKFLGVLLFSSYHSLPQEHLYWCEDEDMSTECVRKCMSKNRWIEIKRNLHFNNNSNILPDGSNRKCFKIAPLYDMLNKSFMQFGVFSQNLSIDEQMVRYYGHHYLKQFIRGKPIRFGFKQWAMCCSETGYLFHTELYEGKQKENEPREMTSLGASVVMKKVALVDNPSNHEFFFDNFFTSHQLMEKLTEKGVCATGTAQLKMMNKCPLKDKKEMIKEERGTYDFAHDRKSHVFAVSWKDNNTVKIMSNNKGLNPIQKVNRWSRNSKKYVKVDQPYCIASYNTSMGGVDKMDWYVNRYRIKVKGKKWYFPIFTFLIDTTLVNAYILYCLANTKIPLLDFKRSVTRAYLARSSISDPKNAGRPSYPKAAFRRVEEAVRLDPVGHMLERTTEGKQRKCGICKTNVRKQCVKCNVGLHVQCFSDWHKKKQ